MGRCEVLFTAVPTQRKIQKLSDECNLELQFYADSLNFCRAFKIIADFGNIFGPMLFTIGNIHLKHSVAYNRAGARVYYDKLR